MGVINPVHLLQAVWNAARMDQDERARRLLAAFISRDVYNAGMRLQRLAQQIGEGFEEEVNAYLRTSEILVVEKVWGLTEANEIRGELEQRIAEAQQRLEGENDV